MKKAARRRILGVVLVVNVLVFVSFLCVLFLIPSPQKEILSDLYPVLLAWGAAFTTHRIYRSLQKERRARRVWGLMFSAMNAWLIAETLWVVYELQGLEPYPSLADLFYLMGDGLLVAFFLLQSRFLRVFVDGGKRKIALAALIFFIVVSVVLVYQPILSSAAEASFWEVALPVLYETTYLLTLVGSTNLTLALWDGAAGKRWLAIALGIWLYAFANQFFFFAEWNNFYRAESQMNWVGVVFDLTYVASYQLLLTGFYLRYRLSLPQVELEDILFSLKRSESQTLWVLLSDNAASTLFVDPRLSKALAQEEVGSLVGETVDNILRLPLGTLEKTLATLRKEKISAAPTRIILNREVYALYAMMDGEDANANIYWIVAPWKTGGKLNLQEAPSPESLLGYAMRGADAPLSAEASRALYVENAFSFLTLMAAQYGGSDMARQISERFHAAETSGDRRQALLQALQQLAMLTSAAQIQESLRAFHANMGEPVLQAAKEAGLLLDGASLAQGG